MSEAQGAKNPAPQSQPPAHNTALDEAVWQKWVNKNRERDAARRRRLLRMLPLVFLLFLVGVVVWWLTASR